MLATDKLDILIAEDDEDDRFLVQTAFNENKFRDHLHFIENGFELIQYLKQPNIKAAKLPDFILLDLNMPKKNGREVLAELEHDALLCKIPVIVFSTTNNDIEKKRCIELGAKAYFTKPVSYAELIKVIAEIRNIIIVYLMSL